MADITVTATNVFAGGGSTVIDGILGATLGAGTIVYIEAASGTAKACDADSTTAEVRSPVGFLLNGGVANQPCKILTAGPITLGAVLTNATTYYLSPSATGVLCLDADVLTGDYPIIMGQATSTSVLNVKIQNTGVLR